MTTGPVKKFEETNFLFTQLIGFINNSLINKAKSYSNLYICIRNDGRKVAYSWFDFNSALIDQVTQFFEGIALTYSTLEIELLHSAEIRNLDLKENNSFNSLRGRNAIFIHNSDKVIKYSALEMISKNLSFKKLILNDIKELGLKTTDWLAITLYQSDQYLFSHDKPPSDLYRGNKVVNLENITKESTQKSALMMTEWLVNQMTSDGKIQYKYWPSRGEYSHANNTIRQWMATVCLIRTAKALNSTQLLQAAELNLSYNLQSFFKTRGELGYIYLDGSAKLGAISLAALAILEAPFRRKFLKEEYALRKTVDHLHNADGSFRTFLIPAERTDNQNFYSGEALLFWAVEFSISKNPELLKKIMTSFSYYKDWHLKNRNPAFVPWHTQAYYLVWQETKDDQLKEFIFKMNDWLLSMQQWETSSHPDMKGRFYDPKRSYFGPPHASSTAVYLEGLIDAFQLAKNTNEPLRAEMYRIAILRGIRSITQLQFKDGADCFYLVNKDRVLGGVRTTVYDNTIRIDNVQHALMALLKILKRFSDQDYRVQ